MRYRWEYFGDSVGSSYFFYDYSFVFYVNMV